MADTDTLDRPQSWSFEEFAAKDEAPQTWTADEFFATTKVDHGANWDAQLARILDPNSPPVTDQTASLTRYPTETPVTSKELGLPEIDPDDPLGPPPRTAREKIVNAPKEFFQQGADYSRNFINRLGEALEKVPHAGVKQLGTWFRNEADYGKPQFDVPRGPGKTLGDTAGAINEIIAKASALTLVGAPRAVSTIAAFASQAKETGGSALHGAGMGGVMVGFGMIPAAALGGAAAKLAIESGLFGELTAAQGGTWDEVLSTMLIPPALRGVKVVENGVRSAVQSTKNGSAADVLNVTREVTQDLSKLETPNADPTRTAAKEVTPEAARAAETQAPKAQEAVGKPPWTMSIAELDKAIPEKLKLHKQQQVEDQKFLATILGEEGAKRYLSLERKSGSDWDIAGADKASAEIDAIHKSVGPEKSDAIYNRLYESGIDYKAEMQELRDMRAARGNVDSGSVEEMAASLYRKLTYLPEGTDTSKWTWRNKEAVAAFSEASQIAREKGFDTAKLSEEMVKRAATQFDPSDLDLMLGRFMKPEQQAGPRQAEMAALTADIDPTVKLGTGLGPLFAEPAKTRADVVPEIAKAPTPEIEQRMANAHGLKPPSLMQRVAEVADSAWRKSTRPQEFIPKTPEFAVANEFFRLLKNVPEASKDQINRDVAAIIDPMGPKQQELFSRKLVADNMVASVERGEPLRFGFKSVEELTAYRDQLNRAAEQVPEIKQALETRSRVVHETVKELVDHQMLDPKALENADSYFHQQVLTYMQAQKYAGGGTKPTPIKRGFQKARVKGESLPEEFDYNTSYIEAEASWMTEARMELQKANLLKTLSEKYDKLPQLQEQAKALDLEWRGLIPKDHDVWQPEPGNVFYRAFTIPERVVESVLKGTLEASELTPEQIRTVLALGGPKQEMVLPRPLVEQLNAAVKPKPSGALGKLADGAMRAWKGWTLLNPKRALGYMLRNVTGDVDAVVAADPGALRYMSRAMSELRSYYSEKLSMSPELQKARDLGVVSASMTTQDIPSIKDLPVFKRFYKSRQSMMAIPGKMVAGYYDKVRSLNEFREASLRYSSYLHYLDKLKAGTLDRYGGSNKKIVDALKKDMGNEVAAAHLSRNLLGDYGNLTATGNYLRQRVIPFYSWMEVNAKRLANTGFNAAVLGQLRGTNIAAKAVYTGLATAQIGTLYSIFWLWNHLMHPEEEKDLSRDEQASPHITVGRNDDGSIMLLRNVGALGDVLEWFGINTLMSLYPQYESDQITLPDLITAMAKDPLNKLAQGVRPDIKGAFEVATGSNTYPDILDPRSQPRGEAAANVVGLRDEYLEGRGRLLDEGKRARPHYLQRMIGVSDPKQNALQEMYDLREKFLVKEGRPRPSFSSLPGPFRDMRQAAYADDFEAFKEARQKFLAGGKTDKSFERSLASIDPLAQQLNEEDEEKFENTFLNSTQRKKLAVARAFAAELSTKMSEWWERAQ